MLEAAGPQAQAIAPAGDGAMADGFVAALAQRYCNMRKTTIYAGSNEIQRNIIARHALGL
jgi:alkylation response protein AidB-like acyl-CoA dehydrogenase